MYDGVARAFVVEDRVKGGCVGKEYPSGLNRVDYSRHFEAGSPVKMQTSI